MHDVIKAVFVGQGIYAESPCVIRVTTLDGQTYIELWPGDSVAPIPVLRLDKDATDTLATALVAVLNGET